MNQVKRGRDDKTEGGLWPDVPVATSAICFFFFPSRSVPAHPHTTSFPVPTYISYLYQIWLDCPVSSDEMDSFYFSLVCRVFIFIFGVLPLSSTVKKVGRVVGGAERKKKSELK
jgi:hypothetical protein